MRILVGIDIQSIDDVEASMSTFGNRYLERVYTSHEIETISVDSRPRATGLAERFAAKEAVMKVLNHSDVAIPWHHIEIQTSLAGASSISLKGLALEQAQRLGVDHLSVSLSHTNRLATAVVVGESTELEYEGTGDQ